MAGPRRRAAVLSVFKGRFAERGASVTGGASCLGRAVTARIVAEGGTAVLRDSNADALAVIASQFGAAHWQALDVADERAVGTAAATLAALGGLNILVYPADHRGDCLRRRVPDR